MWGMSKSKGLIAGIVAIVAICLCQRLIPNPNALQFQLTSSSTISNLTRAADTTATYNRNPVKVKTLDCAVNWIRVPKTASTSIYKILMEPLLQSGNFSSTFINANTCVKGVGGCARYWNQMEGDFVNRSSGEEGAPQFGLSSGKHGKRCFPSTTNHQSIKSCYEYDATTNKMDFGPVSSFSEKNSKAMKEISPSLLMERTQQTDNSASHTLTKENTTFTFSPNIADHVGLDVSLFGWIMPQQPMVFSAFRDPLERLTSSFHYGIRFGAHKPGRVAKCALPSKPWTKTVMDAREVAIQTNETSEYQRLFLSYLNTCSDAVSNTYVQFLDPNTKDLAVALTHLNEYVIVGLQSDIDGTLDRWTKIVLQSCQGHPRYQVMKDHIMDAFKVNGDHRYKDTMQSVGGENSSEVASLSSLSSPLAVETFDNDLQRMIHEFIAGDIVIYLRAIELYYEQRGWV